MDLIKKEGDKVSKLVGICVLVFAVLIFLYIFLYFLFISNSHILGDSNTFASLIEKGLIYFHGGKYFILDALRGHFQKIASELEDYNDIDTTCRDAELEEQIDGSGEIYGTAPGID